MRIDLAMAFGCSLKEPILFFKNDYDFLSNFWISSVEYDGVVYNSSEHAYVAQKTLDQNLRDQIKAAITPGQVKRLGRNIALRDDWEDIKIGIMYEILHAKFSQNAYLKALLLATGNRYLEEGNTWSDTFWGVCNGVGENHLGQLLMLLRTHLNGTINDVEIFIN